MGDELFQSAFEARADELTGFVKPQEKMKL
jgi:hypothetical protein